MSEYPFAYIARPFWERDDARVFPDLLSLVQRCDEDQTFSGPVSVRVMAVYPDGREEEVPQDAYSCPNPASREEAEAFVRWRQDAGDEGSLFGSLRTDPNLPFDQQVAQYIENSPRRWKTAHEINGLGGKAL